MANAEEVDVLRRSGRRKLAEIGSDRERYRLRGDIKREDMPTLDELLRTRTDSHSDGSTRRRSVRPSRMVTSSIARSSFSGVKSSSRHRHKSSGAYRSEAETKPRRKTRTSSRDDHSHVYVYGHPKSRDRSSAIRITERRRSGPGDESDERDKVMSIVSEESEPDDKPKPRKVKVIYVGNEPTRSSKHHVSRKILVDEERPRVKESARSQHRSHTTVSRRPSSTIQPLDMLRRTLSARDVRDSRPPLKRSHTTSHVHSSSRPVEEPSIVGTRHTSKRSSFFGIPIFAQPKEKEERPVRLVECLTCLSDDIPRHKSAKLKCGHRMCHSCLKRIFKLSVNDPQHMPPKCCTSDHIPLKHVDPLFDNDFKKLWNKKFQEYTTKNRIYCPSRRCGEWIKPGNIHTENGKKYGKCGRCRTKVCCVCNGKWHGNKDCPKDEETNAILEAAKKAGWQRCYNCRTMVELKEGCNHMTCRCRAEFCMICGLKWKSCNCPWFNYEQVENDRLNHMRIPRDENVDDIVIIDDHIRLQRPPRPRAYRDEIQIRRRQEMLDEELARRLQVLGIDDDDDDYSGGIGNIEGIGNAGPNFMNDNYRRLAPNGWPNLANAAANYVMGNDRERVVPPPPASPVRAGERLVARRQRMDYASEAAIYAPAPAAVSERRARQVRPPPRDSVLAGLGGAGRGSGRVGEWRAHVQPGVVPEEGVLSIV